jgi:hypothetical protein
MSGPVNGAQYAIESIQRSVTSDNFVRNKGDNANVRISGTSLVVDTTSVVLPTAAIGSQRAGARGFPGSGAATTMFDFATPGVPAFYPVGSLFWISVIDGAGVLATASGSVGAGNVPTISSQSAAFSEAGVTAAVFAVAGTAVTLAITGKTVASTGAIRIDRVV